MCVQSPRLAPDCECSQGSAMVKIVDVARHAKVSTATVSRVINKNSKVADDLRERVERSIMELGYNLNVAARPLRTQRSSKLLLIVPDISNPSLRTSFGARKRPRGSPHGSRIDCHAQ